MVKNRLAEDIVSTTLRVFVGEHWPERPATVWVALDATGDVLQQGQSDALHWPAADFCEAVMSAPQVSWLRTSIPERVSRLDLKQVVASALEDRLLEDPDQCHLTLCSRDGAMAEVLVVSRTRMRNVLAQFNALKRPLSALYSELQTQRSHGPECTVALSAEAAILDRPGETPLALDLADSGDVPLLLGPVLRNAAALGDPTVTVRAAPGIAVDMPKWRAALGTDRVSLGPEYLWHRLDGRAMDLLHDEFEPRQRRSNLLLMVKSPAIVAAAALSAYLVVTLFQVGSQHYRISQAQDRMAELFRGAFPDVPAVAPLAQTRRQLDALRASHGLLRSDDALTLLAVVADVLGAEGKDAVRSVNYEKHRLTLAFGPPWSSRLDTLRWQLMAKGLVATVAAGPQNSSSLIIEQNLTR